jgi:hypothetical protein
MQNRTTDFRRIGMASDHVHHRTSVPHAAMSNRALLTPISGAPEEIHNRNVVTLQALEWRGAAVLVGKRALLSLVNGSPRGARHAVILELKHRSIAVPDFVRELPPSVWPTPVHV